MAKANRGVAWITWTVRAGGSCSSGGRWLRRRLVEEHSFDPLAGYKNPVPPYSLQQAVPFVVHLLEFAPAELDKGRPTLPVHRSIS